MIYFHAEEIKFPPLKRRITKNWIKRIVLNHKKEVGEINIIFCTDAYLLSINQQYLKHNDLTDVITFDYVEKNIIGGDIFISLDRIKENAKNNDVPFLQELLRVIIHGVLHLLGFEDKTPKLKEEMRERENECLKIYDNE